MTLLLKMKAKALRSSVHSAFLAVSVAHFDVNKRELVLVMQSIATLFKHPGYPGENPESDQLPSSIHQPTSPLVSLCPSSPLPCVQFEADRRAFIITINSFGTELSKEDRAKLFPHCGKLYPEGLAQLARADDYEQVKAVADYYPVS